MSESKTNLKTKTLDKKQQVMEATLNLIMENGVQATSMAKVSKASGVAVGTIYHHFSSKEAIITELYRFYKQKLLLCLSVEFDEAFETKDLLKKSVYLIINFAKEQPIAFEFIETYHNSPLIDQDVRAEFGAAFSNMLKGYFDQLRQEGFINMSNTNEMLELYINGAIFGMIRAQIAGHVNWTQEEINKYIDMIWFGIAHK